MNLGGNVLNLSNLGNVQTLGAVRPGGIIQPIQIQPNPLPQVQQFPNFVQVPVSANGQTAFMPLQMQPFQQIQDLTQVAATSQTATVSNVQQTPQILEVITQTPSKSQIVKKVDSKPSVSSVVSSPSSATASTSVMSMSQLQNMSMQGQTIAAAAAAANIIPQMQLIPLGNGNYMQAAVFPSQAGVNNGQNIITVASLPQNTAGITTTTTNSTSTISSPQQANLSNILNPQVLQGISGQNFGNIQISNQGQIVAAQNQVLNLGNIKNGQFPIQVQNLQNIQPIQNLQGFQNLQGIQMINGQQIQGQIIGTPISNIQGLGTLALNAQGNFTTLGPIGAQGSPQQLTSLNLCGQQTVQGLQQLQNLSGATQLITGTDIVLVYSHSIWL